MGALVATAVTFIGLLAVAGIAAVVGTIGSAAVRLGRQLFGRMHR